VAGQGAGGSGGQPPAAAADPWADPAVVARVDVLVRAGDSTVPGTAAAAALEHVRAAAAKAGLQGFEVPAALLLVPAPWLPERADGGGDGGGGHGGSGGSQGGSPPALLTPTFKVKRHQAARTFAAEVERLYGRVPEPKER